MKKEKTEKCFPYAPGINRKPVPTPTSAIMPYTVGLWSIEITYAKAATPAHSIVEPKRMGHQVFRGHTLHMYMAEYAPTWFS